MKKSLEKRIRGVSLFSVLIIFVSALLIISLFFLFFRSQKELTVTVKINEDSIVWPNQGVSSWFATMFHEGMEEKDGFGNAVARVVNVRSYYTSPDASKKDLYLTVKIKTTYSISNRIYTYKGKNVLIGQTIELFLDQVLADGLIVDIEGYKNPFPQKKLLVTAQVVSRDPVFPGTEGVMPYVAQAVHVGDIVKDNHDNTVLKVINKTTEPAKLITTTQNGSVSVQSDPIKVDVYLQLEITAQRIGSMYYYFYTVPVTVNKLIPINFNTITIWPVITSVKEIP